MSSLRPLIALSLVLGLAAGCDTGEVDGDFPLSDLDSLLEGVPSNDELPEDGKFDARYPAQFDLVALQSPVKSQGRRGVCSIFSTTALMEHLYIKEGTIRDPDFSEQFLQWSVKNEVGSFPNTSGSNARSNLDAIHRFGVVTEDVSPYEPSGWGASDDPECTGDDRPTRCYTNGEPSQEVLAAQRWTLPPGRYVNSRTRSIKAFMSENNTAVVAGMTFFYQSWNHGASDLPVSDEYSRNGYVLYPNAEDQRLSLENRAGHSILLVGWDDELSVPKLDENGEQIIGADGEPEMETGFWLFKNSWGTGRFGTSNPHGAGYGWISYAYVQQYASVYSSREPNVDLREVCDDGLDNDFNGDVDCDDAACETSCAPPEETLHYENNDATPIPDNDPAGIRSTIQVGTSGALSALQVRVDITHTYSGDLVVKLVSPSGTEATLRSQEGGSSDDIVATWSPDDFAGESVNGTWTLVVSDHAGQDVGTLNRWTLDLAVDGGLAVEDCDDGVDNNENGLLDCADPDCAADSACASSRELSFRANENTPIPDNDPQGIFSLLEVNESGRISSLEVGVDITHSYRGDLNVSLEHESGVVVSLHEREGGGADDLVTSFVVDDFNGLQLNGLWSLNVSDNANIDTGTLNSWTLDVVVE